MPIDRSQSILKSAQIQQLISRLRRLERGEYYLRRGTRVTSSGGFGRPLNSVLTDGRVDPRSAGFIPQGSTAVTIFPTFTGTATDTAITWNWGGALGHADGTSLIIPASSLTVTGLTPSTTYYFYPFFATLGCGIGFVGGDAGSPRFAHTTTTNAAVLAQSLQDREPLSLGAMFATTRATPGSDALTGGGSGDGAGYSGIPGGCPRDSMVVESLSNGIVRCDWLELGERIVSPDGEGWTEIVGLDITPCPSFILIRTEAGDEIEISPETPQPMFDDSDKPAGLLSLNDRVMVRQPGGGSGYVAGLEWVDAPEGKRVLMACQPSHRFWCGRHAPNIAAHNAIAKQ